MVKRKKAHFWQIGLITILLLNMLLIGSLVVLTLQLNQPAIHGRTASAMAGWGALSLLLVAFYYGGPLAIVNSIFFWFYLKKYKPKNVFLLTICTIIFVLSILASVGMLFFLIPFFL